MRTRLTLHPGQDGAKRMQAQYGDRLVCVRYRYDERRQKRFKTVELIVEESDWAPQIYSFPLRYRWCSVTVVRVMRELFCTVEGQNAQPL